MMLDQKSIYDTLQKINASLNKRFEKDAELYISKQDEYEIRKHLCTNAFRAVVNMANGRKIKPEIILKVLIRSAGLMTEVDMGKLKKELTPTLNIVNFDTVGDMIDDVLSDTVYIDRKLKQYILKLYFDSLVFADKLHYWNSTEYYLSQTVRWDLFTSIIESNDVNLDSKWDFFVKAVEEYKYLIKATQDSRLMIRVKSELPEKESEKLYSKISTEIRNPHFSDYTYDNLIVSMFVSYGDKAFDESLDKIKKADKRFKVYIKTISDLVRFNDSDTDIIINRFDKFNKFYNTNVFERYVKNELDKKFWKAAKSNTELYTSRQTIIDANIVEEEKKVYSSFNDVLTDINSGNKPTAIAFVWANMKSDVFKQSLKDAFEFDADDYLEEELELIFKNLFQHCQRYSNGFLKKTCILAAEALIENNDVDEGIASVFDSVLLEYIKKYKVSGRFIPDYMTKYHFEDYKKF